MAGTSDVALLGPADVRSLAAELGIRPTKKLGQNFVHDPNTVRRVAGLAELSGEDVVLEVGPGLGSLTLGLLDTGASVVAVEVDSGLAGCLARTVAGRAGRHSDRLTVLCADALRLEAADLERPPTTLVANLPYNVAVPVVLHLLAAFPSVRRALVMVQAEVADRMVAGPGSRVYGVPSVKLAWFGTAQRAGAVPRSVFWPVPNVDSALVRFDRGEPPASGDRETTFALVDAAFAQRRKMLRAALAPWFGSAARAAESLVSAGIDPATRGERLTVADFARLAAQVRAADCDVSQ
ncbi:16S rRNA (adenine1518-N6/adenine1519-N6)-dimethyltransferase [Haloechinothrix alba]|uniref:Ribosomal RNA small subunit methyltransferase A n=1 Tax=Haloechinothrix alba TaxID=664784 RepID=A0A238VF43_9PSEU|nr:16S rRNA (adenine(1518)-N(6)/adenine(1519)-N(6))-dimethyltransferase RsmA [Haloechinothrix alba]SNR32784.1 16S rRNA (adenine1518-N6/adenine1519-N6)-dimethyltransferase [Haloechinothrix alba]